MRYMFRVHHFSISFYGNSLKSLHEKGIVVWRNQIFPINIFFSTDDDPSFLKAVLRLTDETFTSDLKDPLSEKFKTLSAWLENILMSLYTEVHGFRDVEVVRFR